VAIQGQWVEEANPELRLLAPFVARDPAFRWHPEADAIRHADYSRRAPKSKLRCFYFPSCGALSVRSAVRLGRKAYSPPSVRMKRCSPGRDWYVPELPR
jgi:hypothetical protein